MLVYPICLRGESLWERPPRRVIRSMLANRVEGLHSRQVYSFFAGPDVMMKFCKNLDGPCPAPTYLPTYLPYLWETKKEINGEGGVPYQLK